MNNNGKANPGKGWFSYFGTVSMVRKEKLQVARLEKIKNITELLVQLE